jgi:lysophospholipase L1-like esterase
MKRRWPVLLAALPIVVGLRAVRVLLSVNGRRRYWQTRSAQGDFFLVALGDSLTQGIGSSRPATSWLGRYVTFVEAQTGRHVRLNNRATYGAKIADLLADQLPLPEGTDLVTMCIGANDAGRTHPDEFRALLRSACEQLPNGSIVGDVPEFQWGPRIRPAEQLAEIVREVVAEFPTLRLAEVEKETTGTRIFGGMAGDFFHPNNASYQNIATAFMNAGPPLDSVTA